MPCLCTKLKIRGYVSETSVILLREPPRWKNYNSQNSPERERSLVSAHAHRELRWR